MDRDIPQDIKNTVLELIADFRENIFTKQEEKGDLMLVEFFFSKMSPDVVADRIVKHVLPHAKKINNRDVSFFLEKRNEIFGGLPSERVEYFANLIENPESHGGLTEENKIIVFQYFDTFVCLGEEYKKNK